MPEEEDVGLGAMIAQLKTDIEYLKARFAEALRQKDVVIGRLERENAKLRSGAMSFDKKPYLINKGGN